MGEDMHLKTKKEVFFDSVKVLDKLANIAKPYGIKLAFEPIGDKRWCVRSLDQALEIVEAVNRDDVGLALDSINLFLYNRLADIDSIDRVPLDKVFVYHIDDCEDLPWERWTIATVSIRVMGLFPFRQLPKNYTTRDITKYVLLNCFARNIGNWNRRR
jgi:sugar phosphate isomerase/epimerase